MFNKRTQPSCWALPLLPAERLQKKWSYSKWLELCWTRLRMWGIWTVSDMPQTCFWYESLHCFTFSLCLIQVIVSCSTLWLRDVRTLRSNGEQLLWFNRGETFFPRCKMVHDCLHDRVNRIHSIGIWLRIKSSISVVTTLKLPRIIAPRHSNQTKRPYQRRQQLMGKIFNSYIQPIDLFLSVPGESRSPRPPCFRQHWRKKKGELSS